MQHKYIRMMIFVGILLVLSMSVFGQLNPEYVVWGQLTSGERIVRQDGLVIQVVENSYIPPREDNSNKKITYREVLSTGDLGGIGFLYVYEYDKVSDSTSWQYVPKEDTIPSPDQEPAPTTDPGQTQDTTQQQTTTPTTPIDPASTSPVEIVNFNTPLPPEGAVPILLGYQLNDIWITPDPRFGVWVDENNVAYGPDGDSIGTVKTVGQSTYLEVGGQGEEAGVYIYDGERTLFIADEHDPKVYPNGAFIYTLDGDRVFANSNNDERPHQTVTFDGEPAVVDEDIFLDQQGGFYDRQGTHYSNGKAIWGGGIFGQNVFYAPYSENSVLEEAERTALGKKDSTKQFEACTRYSGNLLCKPKDSTDDKFYQCEGVGDDIVDCSQKLPPDKAITGDEIGFGGFGILSVGNALDDLTVRTRGLRTVSLFYSDTPEWWFELDETTSNILGGIDGWSSLICRQPVTESDVVGLTFSSGIENAYAHIQGERLTVINYTGTEQNTYYLYKISMEVNPGSNVNGCDMKFQVFIGDKPLFIDDVGQVTQEGFTQTTEPFTFDLEKGNGSVSYIGNDLVLIESQTLYDEVSIKFGQVRPQACLIGISSGDSLTATIVDLGNEQVNLGDNRCSGLRRAFFPGCWGPYSLPQQDTAQQQQQQASVNPNA